MAQTTIGDAHGLYKVWVGLVDDKGYNMGIAGPDVANNTLTEPYHMRYVQSAEISMQDRTVINFTGGDVWTGSFIYGITQLGTFSLTNATVEAELIALLSDSAIDQTLNTRQTIYSENIMLASPPQVWMMIVFRLQSKEPGTKGASKFMNLILPRVWMSPKGLSGAPAFQANSTYGYQIVPTVGDRMPFGPLFSTSTLGLANDETPVFYIITDYPLHTVTIKATASASMTVNLPYLPVYFDVTTPDSATDPVQVYVNGVQVDATSVNLTTGAVVVPSGGTFVAGDIITVLYETNYVEAP